MNPSYPGTLPKTPGSWLALLATVMGIAAPFVPAPYLPAYIAVQAGVGAAATKLQ